MTLRTHCAHINQELELASQTQPISYAGVENMSSAHAFLVMKIMAIFYIDNNTTNQYFP
jgi:hypothetical protein